MRELLAIKYTTILYVNISKCTNQTTVSPLYLRVPHLQIQPTEYRKYLGKKIPESSKNQDLNLPCTGNYFHSIVFTLY